MCHRYCWRESGNDNVINICKSLPIAYVHYFQLREADNDNYVTYRKRLYSLGVLTSQKLQKLQAFYRSQRITQVYNGSRKMKLNGRMMKNPILNLFTDF